VIKSGEGNVSTRKAIIVSKGDQNRKHTKNRKKRKKKKKHHKRKTKKKKNYRHAPLRPAKKRKREPDRGQAKRTTAAIANNR